MKKRNRRESAKGISLAAQARPYASLALAELARIMMTSRNPVARVAACNALLNRGFGKPAESQSLATTDAAHPFDFSNKWTLQEAQEQFKILRSLTPDQMRHWSPRKKK